MVDPAPIIDRLMTMRDQAYAHREGLPLNSLYYNIYSHRADALNEAVRMVQAMTGAMGLNQAEVP